ncbi:TonB family protein [Archangium violaceum]|uniref:energy transducer TonB n=1 Tax=Archangium violaceum TaxID=83451 RepID=UPI00193BCD81|nr:energy transducer TonB [Archangium violaceum]QRK12751.1 TonB family protein [Archangium violaceum]
MPRSLPWSAPRVLVSLLLGVCAPSTVHAGEPVCTTGPSAYEVREQQRAMKEIRQKAEFLCRHQLLPWPVLSRLPKAASPSEFIRQEDLDFVQRHPPRVPLTELDTHGLHKVLAHFAQCQVSVWRQGQRATASIRESRPRWEDPSLLTPEVIAPQTPTRRMAALVRWTLRHPDTVTREYELAFQLTPAGWRAAYLLPEEEERRTHPIDVSRCSAQREGMAGRPFEQDMTPPRLLSGAMPPWTREAVEARIQGLFTARCRLTREGEPRECCVLKSLPFMDEAILRALSKMRFTPVEQQGQPIEVTYDFKFRMMQFRTDPCESPVPPYIELAVPAASNARP